MSIIVLVHAHVQGWSLSGCLPPYYVYSHIPIISYRLRPGVLSCSQATKHNFSRDNEKLALVAKIPTVAPDSRCEGVRPSIPG